MIKFQLATNKGLLFIATSDVVRMEASSNYTRIYFIDNKKLLSAKLLRSFEQQLSDVGFVRIHKTHLVNQEHIKYIDRTNGHVCLRDDSVCPISRRKKKALITKLAQQQGLKFSAA
jgi:two-component system, LytTR family, response regulator